MSKIMDCPNCGRKLRLADGPADTQFQCPTCSHTFAPPTPEPAAMKRCRFCREDILLDAVVCRHCGENQNDPRPPWERPGGMRLDWEPHRGGHIQNLGIVGVVCCMIPCVVWIGVPLAISVLVMGRHDLQRMTEKEMDPRGRHATLIGIRCAGVGLIFASIWLLSWGGTLFAYFLP